MNICERIAAWFRPKPRVTVGLEAYGIPDGFPISNAHPHPIFAKAGETIVCAGADQHEIATFLYDVNIGDFWRPDAIGKWQQPEPEPRTKLPITCTICKAAWIWPGNHLHFKDGWR